MNWGHHKSGDRAHNLEVGQYKQKAAKKECIELPTCLIVINQTRKMLLIVDAPTYQRWQMSRSDTYSQRGVCWLGMSRGQGETPRLMEEWSLCPQTPKPVVGGWTPQVLGIILLLLTPFTPSLSGEETHWNPLACELCPLWYPPWWLWSSMAMVQTYGTPTIPALDVIEGGWWC